MSDDQKSTCRTRHIEEHPEGTADDWGDAVAPSGISAAREMWRTELRMRQVAEAERDEARAGSIAWERQYRDQADRSSENAAEVISTAILLHKTEAERDEAQRSSDT